ncbi:MAG: MotA/TolQ/ExbB proton channel family protein [Bacteriovoracaceae bacterium]|nr:MotA/TolQ/ExbB proton channel family protein [Bacteriovoracaceae bacterium]
MKYRILRRPYAFAGLLACSYQLLVVASFEASSASVWRRISILLGGDLSNGGIIQGIIVFSSLWAYLEIKKSRDDIKREFGGLCLSILPTSEKHVLLPMDLPNIELKLSQLSGKKKNLLVKRLLLAAISKFKSTSSMGETIEIISIQSEIIRDLHESAQSNIRYLLWLIPSIGFMGTVIGISQSLAIAHTGKMDDITSTLGVAFDTTLVSLILGAIVTGLFHKLQEETDRLHAYLKEYVIVNFVNRLELKKLRSNPVNSKVSPNPPKKAG